MDLVSEYHPMVEAIPAETQGNFSSDIDADFCRFRDVCHGILILQLLEQPKPVQCGGVGREQQEQQQ